MNPQMELKPSQKPNQDLVSILRNAALSNPAFNAVCHVFAIRERARQQVTLNSLMLRMAEEGYKFSAKDYKGVLKFMSTLGIGTLDLDPRTKEVRALKNIKLTLQSIGKAALGGVEPIERFNPSFDFQKIQAPEVAIVTPAPVAPPPPPAAPPTTTEHAVSLTANIDGTPINFPLPRGLTTQELGELLATLYSERVKK